MSRKKKLGRALLDLSAAVRKDFATIQRYRKKYHNDEIPVSRMPAELVRKIGFQQTTAIRLMHFFRDAGIPIMPMVTSRLIRHVYNSEVHWDAQVEPGLNIIHGVGLIISHAAYVSEGCILFQNVTLGEATDAATRKVGAPRLGRDVHVGPGATLLGPIDIGEGSKIMAGVVLSRSIPPHSIVKPADSIVSERQKKARA